jgi:RNA polymerase sigma-70 factor (ECF subfamily)
MARTPDDGLPWPTWSASGEESKAPASLVQLAQAGDISAFEELVFLHRDAIYRMAYRSVRDVDQAMDIVQDTMIRAWRALPAFAGQSSFSTWLHRVAVHVCIDHARQRQRERALYDRQQSSMAPAEVSHSPAGKSPDQSAIQKENARLIQEALLQLPPRQREAFMLRYLAEESILEVAKTMNCSEGAVKRHLFRATQRLRDILEL